MSLSRTVIYACLFAAFTAAATEKPAFNAATAQLQLPLMFEVNRGQSDARARYLARGRGYTIFLTESEAVLRLSKAGKGSVVRLRPVNASPARVAGENALSGRANYLTSNNPKEWITNVPLFEHVRYERVLPGIDLLYYGKQGRLEYDFVVGAGADPKNIAVEIAGADALRVDANGDLLIRSGEFDLRWKKPFAYQQCGSKRKEVAAGYVLAGNRVSFKLGDYDRNRELVIDPALVYSTYLGGSTDSDPFDGDGSPGSANNSIASIAADSSGSAYVFGQTSANDFPVTSGAFDTTENGSSCSPHGGNCWSLFITKLNPSGSALVYSTYFGKGGSAGDIAVGNNGRAYVVGSVGSDATVPVTTNAFNLDDTFCDVDCNRYGFLSVLNSSGSALVYSTLIGGKSNESSAGIFHHTFANGVAVGVTGVAYVTGSTDATDLMTTPNAYQPAKAGGDDAFFAKISPASTGSASVHYSTYLGGTAFDTGNGVATEGGRAYLTGETGSDNFPTTAGAFDRTRSGSSDAFIAKVDTNQAGPPSLVYSTYYGGSNGDRGSDIALLGNSVHVAGTTTSSNLPTTAGAFDRSLGGGGDAFVLKLNPAGSGLTYATYLGGTSGDGAAAIATDSSGNAIVGGLTVSSNFPTTADAFDRTFSGGTCDGAAPCRDAFLAKLSASGSTLIYSTYFGGSDSDVATGLASNGSNAYLAGTTASTDLPTTSGAFDRTRTGMTDGFVAKFNMAGGCSPGSTDRTVRICQPQDGATVSSPVHVSAAANPGASAIQRMNVWVDGQKKFERQSTNVIEADIPMAAGSRRVTVQAADSAGTFKSTVFITVSGGGPCPAPSENRTINICEPADGATVSSPVRIRATARSSSGVAFSQIYVDGQRVHHVNSASVDTSVPMAAGRRRVTVQSKDNANVLFKKTIFVTVR